MWRTTLLCALKLGQPSAQSRVLTDYSDEIYTRVTGIRPTIPRELQECEYLFFMNDARTKCLFFRDTAGEVVERRDLLMHLTRADLCLRGDGCSLYAARLATTTAITLPGA